MDFYLNSVYGKTALLQVQYDDINSVVIIESDGSDVAHFQLPNQELPEMVEDFMCFF